MHNFLFVAAENDAIPHCKAGGMGDVIRDVPRQIAQNGDSVHVVVPSYSRLHYEGTLISKLTFNLRHTEYHAEIYEVPGKRYFEGIQHYVIHHPEIQAGDIAHIYHNDLDEPFFTDAIKYFIFCTAVAQAVKNGIFGNLDVIHLHDWHSSMILFLRRYHPDYKILENIRTIYSIHNLAIQGIRPFENNYSSVKNFFPDVPFNKEELKDHRYPDCINLMALGIRFSDAVHTVSPSYKKDVLFPSNPPEFIGGEGLESDLQQADKEGRFIGILNGCNYRNIRRAKKNYLYYNIVKAIFRWLQQESKKYKADFLAHTGEKVAPYLKTKPKPSFICSSVARLTEQKFYFFKKSPEAFMEILDLLAEVNGVFILLGTGAPEYEELLRKISHQKDNFLFINGQDEDVIDSIYLESDLYFMPSLFEPCGISQMLAMRNGHPCLVHNTGGLTDTVKHLKNGFVFEGTSYEKKVKNMVDTFKEVLHLYFEDKNKWKLIESNAKKERFTWKKSVEDYYKSLYRLPA